MTEYEMFIAMLQRSGYKYNHYDDGLDYNVTISNAYGDELQFTFDKESGKLIIIE